VSSDSDRIAVPTNGKRPHALSIEAGPEATAKVERAAEPTASSTPGAADLAGAMSPRQLAVGFAILASLGALLASRVLRRRSGR
jgi:hypothetical protein